MEIRWKSYGNHWKSSNFSLNLLRVRPRQVLNDPNSSYLALALSYVSFALIIVTTFSLILESMPAFSYTPAGCGVVELTVELCRPEPDVAFSLIEMTGPSADRN